MLQARYSGPQPRSNHRSLCLVQLLILIRVEQLKKGRNFPLRKVQSLTLAPYSVNDLITIYVLAALCTEVS